MGTISYGIPQAGQLNSTEDPKIATALQTLLTWANGNIDTANLSAAALATLGTFSSGALSSRPAAGIAGRVYYATDGSGVWYHDTGTVWSAVFVAGAWQALTLNAGWIVSVDTPYTPSVRLVGDQVFLKGAVTYSSGLNIVTTLPAGFRPATRAHMSSWGTSGALPVTVDTNGDLKAGSNTANIGLDGLSYSLT